MSIYLAPSRKHLLCAKASNIWRSHTNYLLGFYICTGWFIACWRLWLVTCWWTMAPS